MNRAPIRIGTVFRQWKLLALCMVLGLVGAVIYNAVATPVYTSSSRVLIAVGATGTPDDRLQGANYIQQAMPTFTAAVTSSLVLSPVIDELMLTDSVEELRKHVEVAAGTDEYVISIAASAKTATAAQELAAAITRTYIAIAPGLVAPLAPVPTPTPTPGASSSAAAAAADDDDPPAVVNITTIDEALPPDKADAPILPLALALGAVAGLLIGVIIALLRQALDRRVTSESVIAEIAGAPIIGRLPDIPTARWDDRHNDSDWAEAVRTLRSAMFPWIPSNGPVQLCSASAGEGTSSTVAALGTSLALSGVKVIAVDANLREPTLHTALRLGPTARDRGLADVLRGTTELASVAVATPDLPELTVFPAGETANAGELIAPAELGTMIGRLATTADIVLVDTPAVSTAADALILANSAASVILVVAINRVSEQVLSRAVEQISRAGGVIDGIVITHAPVSSLHESTTPVANATVATARR